MGSGGHCRLSAGSACAVKVLHALRLHGAGVATRLPALLGLLPRPLSCPSAAHALRAVITPMLIDGAHPTPGLAFLDTARAFPVTLLAHALPLPPRDDEPVLLHCRELAILGVDALHALSELLLDTAGVATASIVAPRDDRAAMLQCRERQTVGVDVLHAACELRLDGSGIATPILVSPRDDRAVLPRLLHCSERPIGGVDVQHAACELLVDGAGIGTPILV